MKQQSFEKKYQQNWLKIETILNEPSGKNQHLFPRFFRNLCHQLAVAKNRHYSPQLIDRLNSLAMKSHHQFYQHNNRHYFQWLSFFVWGFPDALRRNSTYVFTALALFLFPLIGMALACYFNEEFIFSFLSVADVTEIESMYDPTNFKIGRERNSDTDIMMFGYYIKNNIGISFQTFASGIFFGLGSVFFLIFNGLALGGVAGHLTQLGYTDTFYPFVVGHGAFELTAIVFSGAAGLKLGYALINPGNLSRVEALKLAGRDAVLIVYGAMLMLIIAAFLEAFWSSSTFIPISVKYTVGGCFWLLVCYYSLFSGKRRESQPY